MQIGLAVTFKHGLPLFHKKYHGNLNNDSIFKDMALELQSRSLDCVIVDRSMTSSENIILAKKLNVKVIAGIKKTATTIKDHIATIKREEIYKVENRVQLKIQVSSSPHSLMKKEHLSSSIIPHLKL